MASFGENLRREREMRGVTLAEISATTKISIRLLEALEAEDFSKVPGGIFARSFIRAYARYLGLDEERVLAEYELVAQPRGDFNLNRLTSTQSLPRRESSRTLLLPLLLAAAMLSGGYALFRYSHRVAEMPGSMSNPAQVPAARTPAASPSHEGSTSPIAPSLAPSEPAVGSSSPTSPGSQTPLDTAKSSPNQSGLLPAGTRGSEAGGGLVLQVAAIERAWVTVDADGKTTLQRVLNPDEIQTLKAKDYFDVTTGNAQGIILTLNGETLKPMGRRGEVKSIHLTREALKNPAP